MNSGLILLSSVLERADMDLLAGRSAAARVWPTGFESLDVLLGGGLRAGELTLLGGPQAVGKTTWALQLTRNIAAAGAPVLYFSFEHDELTLLARLICLESGGRDGLDGLKLSQVRQALEVSGEATDLAARLARFEGGADAVKAVSAWSDRVSIFRASGATTSLDVIRQAVEQAALAGQPPVVIVDYLQKVAVHRQDAPESERVTLIVESLKDLALEFELPVLSIVAADQEGIATGKRLRIHHLRGSSALAYEADVVLILNDKYDVVARHHLVYDVSNAERFREWAVMTIEKNRTGVDRVDVEFRKRFDQSRFETDGQEVREQLIDERVFVE